MKKLIALLMALVLCLSLCACGKSNDSADTTAQLAQAITQIDIAVDNIDNQSSFLLEHWSNVEFFAEELFIKSEWEKNKDYNSFVQSFGTTIYSWRETADSSMSDALEIIKNIEPTDNTVDYYEAIKKYYTAADTYRDLVENFPAGYSKLTYSQAIASQKDNLSTAQSELKFYQ